MATLWIDGLCKKYPAFYLDHVTFEVGEGKIMGFVGRNGAGKTTTIKSLFNYVHPDEGEVYFFGLNFRDNEAEIKRRVGYVGSDGSYYNHVAYHSDGDGTEAGCGGERIRFTGESGTYTLRFYPGDAPYYTMGRTLSLRNMTCIASPSGVKYGEIAASTRTIGGTLYKSGASWADDAAWQKPEGVDVYVVSGLETNGESYKVTLSHLDGDIIPANTGVLLFSEQAPATETDRYWTVEAVGAADAHASYSGTNLLAPVVTPTFIPGTETDASGDVTRRNFIFGFYCLEADSDTPPAVGEYSYQLGFWRSSLPTDAAAAEN